jgi:membrane-bound lytic murein transglycosylase MltF
MSQPNIKKHPQYTVSLLTVIFAAIISLVMLSGTTLFAEESQNRVHISTLTITPGQLSPSEEAELDSMVLKPPPEWTGDFSGMRERQMIRILVPYSKTFFYLDQGHQKGINYEYGKELERWLNKKHPVATADKSWHVVFIPTRRDQLLQGLKDGRGDVATGGLTITESRRNQVDFMTPIAKKVQEVVVTGPGSATPLTIEHLAGIEITVRASSSYYEHLVRLNEQFTKRHLKPIRIVKADEWLEPEDILEMVNAGLIKATVVDHYLAKIWKPLYTKIKIHEAVAINAEGELAWACRKNSPELRSVLDVFMRQHKVGTTFGNIQVTKYLRDNDRVRNATSTEEMRKFKDMVAYFRKFGDNYNFDYLLLMAQGYQESRLNQKAKSHKGAVGVMQLLPSTAADPAIGIMKIDKYADRNIEAGAKYLRLLADNYLDDEEITPVNRLLLAFAAYNAGPGNLRKFRKLAEKSGYDPNVWFQNVEYAAARIVGQETVRYVSNIYKYYLAYAAVDKHRSARQQNASR